MRQPGLGTRRWPVLVAGAALAVVSANGALAGPPLRGDRTVTVMTRNIYFGADLAPVVTAPTPGQFVLATAQAYRQALASDFEERAEAIAAEIDEHGAVLVGIQEGTTWSTGAFMNPAPADNVTVDFVHLIVEALAARGLEYAPVAVAAGFDAEAPAFDPTVPFAADVRLQISDVVLVRTDLVPAALRIRGTSTGTYEHVAIVPTAIGPLTFNRQWAAVDAETYGTKFRFVTTHLEVLSQPLRILQATELLSDHSGSGSPTIYVADYNDAVGEGGATDVMRAAGLTDTWAVAHSGEPGPTSGQAADLRNPVSTLTRRIDIVFATSEWGVRSAEIVGDEPGDRTPSGLWPSDHAGVVVTLDIRPPAGTPGG